MLARATEERDALDPTSPPESESGGIFLAPIPPRVTRFISFAQRALVALVALAAAGGAGGAARAAEDPRFTVCSITINSDDEIQTFRKYLPEHEFRFVELTELASATPVAPSDSWFGRACEADLRCDVLVLSAHFGNTYAGHYGTTFAGRSGHTLALEELERRRCDASCPGVLSSPLEVFLFGCQTLGTTLEGEAVPPADLALLAAHGVPPSAALRLVDEARYGVEGTNNRARMQFVFTGVPHLYGFTEVAPSGAQIRPLLDAYLQGVGDYAAHLRRLKRASIPASVPPNLALAKALEPTCFTEAGGYVESAPESERATRTCTLANPARERALQLEQIESLIADPGFVAYLPTIERFFERHDPAGFDADERAVLARIRTHDARARAVVTALARGLEMPDLRLRILRAALVLGWTTPDEALPVQREIVLRSLRPPVWGEGRDRICGLGADVLSRIEIGADEVPPESYANEFAIQALGCLRPGDERIHARLARSLDDPREWIARVAALALRAMGASQVEVQIALAEQLARPEAQAREGAAAALRTLEPSDPRVIAAIRKAAPGFPIDW